MAGAPTPKWDPIGFDPQPNGGNPRTIVKNYEGGYPQLFMGWDWPLLTFIYPGFDCEAQNNSGVEVQHGRPFLDQPKEEGSSFPPRSVKQPEMKANHKNPRAPHWWLGVAVWRFGVVSHVPPTRTGGSNPNPSHQSKPPIKGYAPMVLFAKKNKKQNKSTTPTSSSGQGGGDGNSRPAAPRTSGSTDEPAILATHKRKAPLKYLGLCFLRVPFFGSFYREAKRKKPPFWGGGGVS